MRLSVILWVVCVVCLSVCQVVRVMAQDQPTVTPVPIGGGGDLLEVLPVPPAPAELAKINESLPDGVEYYGADQPNCSQLLRSDPQDVSCSTTAGSYVFKIHMEYHTMVAASGDYVDMGPVAAEGRFVPYVTFKKVHFRMWNVWCFRGEGCDVQVKLPYGGFIGWHSLDPSVVNSRVIEAVRDIYLKKGLRPPQPFPSEGIQPTAVANCNSSGGCRTGAMAVVVVDKTTTVLSAGVYRVSPKPGQGYWDDALAK
jgi:hypothetical protein